MPGEGSPSDVPPAAFGGSNAVAALGAPFGRYRALHQIGTGSLGPVFRGEDPDTHESVAIKHLQLKIGPERTRLIAEEMLALVGRVPDHPNLPRVLHAGLQGTDLYIVTDLAVGESLPVALREYGPAAMADALPRLRGLADALDLAAAQGVWHGALHPCDIVVSAHDTQLTGLGVVPILERARVRLEPRPPYTAPEVVDARRSSAAADQFALAAVAHEWLFGRRAAGAAHAILEVPSLPGVDAHALAGAFTSAMAPNPAERFESCTAFVEALEKSVVRIAGSSEDPPSTSRGGSSDPPAPSTSRGESSDPPGSLDLPFPSEASLADVLLDPEPQTAQPASRVQDVSVRWRGTLAAADDPATDTTRGFPIGALVAVLIAGIALGILGGYLLTPRPDTSSPATTATASRAPADGPTAPTKKGDTAPAGKAQPFTDAPVAAASSPSRSQEPPAAAGATEPSPAAESTVRPPAVSPGVAPAARADTARLLVRSTPAGASVTIDGAQHGRTPVALRDLDLGTRTLVISRPGYVSAERRVTLTADRPSRSIEVALVPVTTAGRTTVASAPGSPSAATGLLLIESRPSGASVTIDGRASGTTPLTLTTVAPGTHTVLIERVGYRPWTTTIAVKAGARARVAASLVGGQGQE